MKDLFHICLETKDQGFGMTFKVYDLGSKKPRLHRAYVIGVCIFFATAVVGQNRRENGRCSFLMSPCFKTRHFKSSCLQCYAINRPQEFLVLTFFYATTLGPRQ